MTSPPGPPRTPSIPEQPRGAPARRLFLDDAQDRRAAAVALADGAVLGHGFGNFYALTTRPDARTVRAVNRSKGRPLDQVGSITTTPSRVPDVVDWSRLPTGLSRSSALAVVDALLALGPFGFRGPAAADLPRHLTQAEGDGATAQVISPGYGCPSNALFALALTLIGEQVLHVTSANTSHHSTGTSEEPAHWTAAGLLTDFGAAPGFVLLAHRDEAAARAKHPAFAPMSTSILALHQLASTAEGGPALVLERQGSLPADAVREVLLPLGWDVVLGPRARVRLSQRDAPADLTT